MTSFRTSTEFCLLVAVASIAYDTNCKLDRKGWVPKHLPTSGGLTDNIIFKFTVDSVAVKGWGSDCGGHGEGSSGCVWGGTSTANQPQWKLHLQDVESLELHVSTAEEGDTAALHGKKENKKKKNTENTKRNNPHRLPRNHKGVIVGRPGRSAAFPVLTLN